MTTALLDIDGVTEAGAALGAALFQPAPSYVPDYHYDLRQDGRYRLTSLGGRAVMTPTEPSPGAPPLPTCGGPGVCADGWELEDGSVYPDCIECEDYADMLRRHEHAVSFSALSREQAKEQMRRSRVALTYWVGPDALAQAPDGVDAAGLDFPKWVTAPLEGGDHRIAQAGIIIGADGVLDAEATAANGWTVYRGQSVEEERLTDGLFVDVGAMLDGDLETPAPSIGMRTDGAHLFYAGASNVLLGDPESGKSLLARSVAADVLFAGGSVLWIDLDHNGAPAILAGFRAWGISEAVLRDRSRFMLAVADDREQVSRIVAYATREATVPTLAVVDSIGELLSLYGANPNADEEYTPVNRAVMAALAKAGACVVSIDHLAKGHDSRSYGASGTVAKKRAVDGAMYRVEVVRPFAPGKGGKARMLLLKDRHGGVRGTSPHGEKSPEAATFELISRDTATDWRLWAPGIQAAPPQSDLEVVSALVPAPTSAAEVRRVTGWGSTRAGEAFKLWQATRP
ncbi:MAG: recombinase RecA [Nonomuraea muscovyensis]|jgi:hypothetical protein|nr:recombinase RecA [Nonomuraea muscovyensis]